jgi:hypothetical protein
LLFKKTKKVLIQLGSYLQAIEAEKQKIKSQVKRLCQENAWLRDELAASQKKLQESEQNSAQIEVELSHLKYLKELKKYDEDINSNQVFVFFVDWFFDCCLIFVELKEEKEENKKLDLGFPEDEEEQGQNNG